MLYNNDKKTWEPAEGIRGMSYVQVYHHEGNNTYRIVGRSMTDHQLVSWNSWHKKWYWGVAGGIGGWYWIMGSA